jgi:hypothetical protein
MKETKYYCDMCGEEIDLSCRSVNIFRPPLIKIEKFMGNTFKRKYDLCVDCKYEIRDIIAAKRKEKEKDDN